MTPQEWEHVCTLFEAVLDQTPALRDEFIDALEGESLEVRAELHSLLAEHDDQATSLFEGEAVLAAAALALKADESLPRQIGPYTAVRELGRGGMGVVYLARRTELANSRVGADLPWQRLIRLQRQCRRCQHRLSLEQ